MDQSPRFAFRASSSNAFHLRQIALSPYRVENQEALQRCHEHLGAVVMTLRPTHPAICLIPPLMLDFLLTPRR